MTSLQCSFGLTPTSYVVGYRHVTSALLRSAGASMVNIASHAGAGWRERMDLVRGACQLRAFRMRWCSDRRCRALGGVGLLPVCVLLEGARFVRRAGTIFGFRVECRCAICRHQ